MSQLTDIHHGPSTAKPPIGVLAGALALVLVVLAVMRLVTLVQQVITPGVLLQDISLLSPTEGWIVGDAEQFRLDAPAVHPYASSLVSMHTTLAQIESVHTSAFHLHNGQWSRVDVPTSGLERVFDLSPNDAWALTDIGGVYHYDGTAWTLVPGTDSVGGNAFYMDSASDGWIVGNAGAWHYTGGHWIDASNTLPNHGYFPDGRTPLGLESVYMLSAKDGWAVGWFGTILHYDGVSWHMVPSPISTSISYSDPPSEPDRVDLSAIQMVSPTEGWAVGTYENTDSGGYLLHYANGAWSIALHLPSSGEGVIADDSLSSLSPSDVWAAGPAFGPNVYHFTGGRWISISSPCGVVERLAMAAPDTGSALCGNTVLRYQNGVWSVYVNSLF